MRRIVILAVVGTVALSACSTSTHDFRREAVKFLESDDLAKQAGYTFDNAVCDEPSSTTKGVQFTCSATDW